MRPTPSLFSLAFVTLALLTVPALPVQGAPEGPPLRQPSILRILIPAEDLEHEAALQYAAIKEEAAKTKLLLAEGSHQVQLARRIAQNMIPHVTRVNPRSTDWRWEINLIKSSQLNAFCMPGGKIILFTGMIDTLKLDKNELAIVLGHEIAHALREHVREQLGKDAVAHTGANLLSSLFGLGNAGSAIFGGSAKLMALKFSRDDETEADALGLELAARAGYDPRAGITLWEKMQVASKKTSLIWLSNHPANESRIHDLERIIPGVLPLFNGAAGPR